MSKNIIETQLLIDNMFKGINCPVNVIAEIKDYRFKRISKIPFNDERYLMISKIPIKEYDPEDNVTYVYIRISDEKDYYIVYKDFQIQIQVLGYHPDQNLVYFISGDIFEIKDN